GSVAVRIHDRPEPKADALRLVLTERAHVGGPTRSVANGPDDVGAHGIRQTWRESHGDVGDRHRRRRRGRRLTVTVGRPVVAVTGRAKASTESGLQRRSVHAGLDAWHYGWTRVGHV